MGDVCAISRDMSIDKMMDSSLTTVRHNLCATAEAVVSSDVTTRGHRHRT